MVDDLIAVEDRHIDIEEDQVWGVEEGEGIDTFLSVDSLCDGGDIEVTNESDLE